MKKPKINKYKIGLVIGRFQPFHKGHKFLIEKALEFCDQLIIGIGSSNVVDEKNPFTLMRRRRFILEFIKKEQITSKVIKIVTIPDHPDDDVWLGKLLKKTGHFDVSIGDNDWVNGIFEKAGIAVARIGFYKRVTLEGTKIRELIKNDKAWDKRVPEYLVKHIKQGN